MRESFPDGYGLFALEPGAPPRAVHRRECGRRTHLAMRRAGAAAWHLAPGEQVPLAVTSSFAHLYQQASSRTLPDLTVLARALCPPAGEKSVFELNDDTDYEELGFQIDILSVVLADVNAYVRDEWAQGLREGGPLENMKETLLKLHALIRTSLTSSRS